MKTKRRLLLGIACALAGSSPPFLRMTSALLLTSLVPAARGAAEVLIPQPGCSQREYVYLGSRMLAAADALPAGVSVGFASGSIVVDEDLAGTLNVPFTLTTPGPLGCRVQFEYVVTPLTATPNQDYAPPPTPWRDAFPPNSTSGTLVTVPIPIVPDGLFEADETFRVEITAVAGGAVGATSVHQVTIRNDDQPPQITIEDLNLAEGNAGTSVARFKLHLSAPSGVLATVAYATANGEAVAPADYTASSGVATFDLGQTQQYVDVPVVGDAAYEPAERFYLNLSNPTGAWIGDAQGIATIQNDDHPGLSVDEVRAVEGAAGVTGVQFKVTIEGPTPQQATAQWTTADCTATAGDYTPASGAVTFAPNTTTPQTFTVWANGDTSPEGHEVFSVGLSGPLNASLKDPAGHGSLENDDLPLPSASLPTADFNEDGNPDLLWMNTTSGNLVSWQMAGVNRITGGFLDPPSIGNLNWKVVGTPNLDADPQPDILWRNDTSGRLVVWLMEGTQRRTGLFLNPDQESGLDWRVVGTGEFVSPVGGEAPAHDDILWHHQQTGALRLWSMNGTDREAAIDIAGPADVRWKVIGTGDVDGDHDSDIWWRHDATGALIVWRMNGAVFGEALTPSPAAMPDPNWVSGGTPDLDRDGDPDLLWRHAASGNLVVWLMNGANRVCGVYLNPPNVTDANWKLVGPR